MARPILMLPSLLLLPLLLALFPGPNEAHSVRERNTNYQPIQCDKLAEFTDEIKAEIRSKAPAVNKIIDLVLSGSERHSTYNQLADFVDTAGPRMCGSRALERAIDRLKQGLRDSSQGRLDVSGEPALVPRWTIEHQWASMVRPVERQLAIATLGFSVATKGTLEAEAIIVHSFEQLEQMADKLAGKIVVYNYNFTTYEESVRFRTDGAKRAAKHGAAAALVRSVTPLSVYSPHAGAGSRSIPTAALTVEDADLIERWLNRDKKVVLRLNINATNHEDVLSQNIVVDMRGTKAPNEVVLVSGHVDSWYNTEGAMDDGGGMMISYKALDILQKLNLRARRTVRGLLWTCEEFGLYGAKAYLKDHKHELSNFKLVMESDMGTFTPRGLSFINLSPVGQCAVQEVLSMMVRLNATTLNDRYEGSDIALFTDLGVPGLSLYNDNAKYFYFHHTAGDSMSVENPDDLDRATALWAASAHVLADLSIDFA